MMPNGFETDEGLSTLEMAFARARAFWILLMFPIDKLQDVKRIKKKRIEAYEETKQNKNVVHRHFLLRLGKGFSGCHEDANLLTLLFMGLKFALKISLLASIPLFVWAGFCYLFFIPNDIIRTLVVWGIWMFIFIITGLPDEQRRQAEKARGF